MKNTFVKIDKVKQIEKKYQTPFYIYDEKGIVDNVRDLKKAFAWNKGFKEYFAVKATPNPAIIRILKKEGCGVDCSSLTELMMAEALNLKGKDIMFSSNETPKEDYIFCNNIIGIINRDDITHIEFVEKAINKLPDSRSIRYNPGV